MLNSRSKLGSLVASKPTNTVHSRKAGTPVLWQASTRSCRGRRERGGQLVSCNYYTADNSHGYMYETTFCRPQ